MISVAFAATGTALGIYVLATHHNSTAWLCGADLGALAAIGAALLADRGRFFTVVRVPWLNQRIRALPAVIAEDPERAMTLLRALARDTRRLGQYHASVLTIISLVMLRLGERDGADTLARDVLASGWLTAKRSRSYRVAALLTRGWTAAFRDDLVASGQFLAEAKQDVANQADAVAVLDAYLMIRRDELEGASRVLSGRTPTDARLRVQIAILLAYALERGGADDAQIETALAPARNGAPHRRDIGITRYDARLAEFVGRRLGPPPTAA